MFRSSFFLLPLLLRGVISCNSIESGAIESGAIALPDLESIEIDRCHDGDTCRSTTGERIRLACIDAPELKQTYGEASRDYLRSLLGLRSRSLLKNREAKIQRIESDRYGRTIAILYILMGREWEPVQSLQARAGTVWAFTKFRKICPIWGMIEREATAARSNRIGLFASGHAIEPWIWRKQNR
jgi:endonuclease YncB( thermonuclease family)